MPQMAPLNWLPLMLSFSLLMLIMSNKIFFNKNIEPQSTNLMYKPNTMKIKWKW